MAVRRGAGVPPDFPLHEGSWCTYMTATTAIGKNQSQQQKQKQQQYQQHGSSLSIHDANKGIDWSNMERGLLIADEMG